jgi:predicted ATPase
MDDPAGERPKRKVTLAVENFLRHPLATMLIGFALTGVVGTMLTNHFANLRQKEAAVIERREIRRKVVLEVSRLFSERLGRAEVLAVAIERRAAREEVARLKQLYDDAEARAVVVRQELGLLMREAMRESDFESLRSEIETRLARKRLRPLRECVDRASTRALEGGDGGAVVRECRTYDLVAEARACGDVIADSLYDLASVAALRTSDPQAKEIRAKTRNRIEQACP